MFGLALADSLPMMQIIGHSPTELSSAMVVPKIAKVRRVLLADDDPLVRAAVGVLFAHHKGFSVVGEATNGEEAVAMAGSLKPDLLLLDLNMPKKAGLEALRDLGAAVPNMRTVLLTVSIEKRQILEALQLGARGIVLKEAARTVLIEAVNTVMSGMYWINQHSVADVRHVIDELRPSNGSGTGKDLQLTPKETQIIGYIVEGCTNKDIARSLTTSEQVVKNHLGKIFDKLGVFNRLELALYAIDNGMARRH